MDSAVLVVEQDEEDAAQETPVLEELLVEEISIDGMCGVLRQTAFDLDQPWCLDGRVALRPEPFGALLYHFGTRRLSFLKEPLLLAVIRGWPITRAPGRRARRPVSRPRRCRLTSGRWAPWPVRR